MCGRFVLYSDIEKVIKQFKLDSSSKKQLTASYNVAPSQNVLVICEDLQHNRSILQMHWGLIPFWTKEENLGAGIINARIETLENKPSFSNAFRYKRCIIVADGFYEWKKEKIHKQPYYIYLKNGELLGLAGIWDSWKNKEKTITSCAIVTVPPNEPLSDIHDRMPGLLTPKNYSAWLDRENTNITAIKPLLPTDIYDKLTYYVVSPKVNNVRYNQSDCINPL